MFAKGFKIVAQFLFVEFSCVWGFTCLSKSQDVKILRNWHFSVILYIILKPGHWIFIFSTKQIPDSKLPLFFLKLQTINVISKEPDKCSAFCCLPVSLVANRKFTVKSLFLLYSSFCHTEHSVAICCTFPMSIKSCLIRRLSWGNLARGSGGSSSPVKSSQLSKTTEGKERSWLE